MGIYYDESPVDSNYLNPETPSMTKISYSLGMSFRLAACAALDVAYCYVKDTTTPYMLFYGNRYADDEAKTEIYQSEVYTTDFTRHNVALTLGFRF